MKIFEEYLETYFKHKELDRKKIKETFYWYLMNCTYSKKCVFNHKPFSEQTPENFLFFVGKTGKIFKPERLKFKKFIEYIKDTEIIIPYYDKFYLGELEIPKKYANKVYKIEKHNNFTIVELEDEKKRKINLIFRNNKLILELYDYFTIRDNNLITEKKYYIDFFDNKKPTKIIDKKNIRIVDIGKYSIKTFFIKTKDKIPDGLYFKDSLKNTLIKGDVVKIGYCNILSNNYRLRDKEYDYIVFIINNEEFLFKKDDFVMSLINKNTKKFYKNVMNNKEELFKRRISFEELHNELMNIIKVQTILEDL